MEDNSSLDEIFGDKSEDNIEPPRDKKPKIFKGATALLVIGVVVALVGIFVIGLFVGKVTAPQPSDFGSEQPIAEEVYDILKDHYIEDVSKDEYDKLFAAGFASVLDRYTGLFYSYSFAPTNGSYGFTVSVDKYSTKTVTEVNDTGAVVGKLQRGDVLVEARFDSGEWQDIEHLVFDEFKDMTTASHKVALKVRRDGNIVTINTVEKTFPNAEPLAYYSDTPYDQYGYIRLREFDNGAAAAFFEALYYFANSGNSRLILDLRGNPGGTNFELAKIVHAFIAEPTKSDLVINVKTRDAVQRTDAMKYTAKFNDRVSGNRVSFDNEYIGAKILSKTGKPFKLVILANDQSASATEAFIGNIIHYMPKDDYLLLGESERTFGKGIAQQTFELDSAPGVLLHVTVGKYYVLGAYGTDFATKETNIHERGYALDNEGIVVEYKPDMFDESIIKVAIEKGKKWDTK